MTHIPGYLALGLVGALAAVGVVQHGSRAVDVQKRRSDLRRMMDPKFNASPNERAVAQRELAKLGAPAPRPSQSPGHKGWLMEQAMRYAESRDTRSARTSKMEWGWHGKATLLGLAEDLGLPEGSYRIDFNPGGPAVMGECTLHHDRFEVILSPFGNRSAFGYARRLANGRIQWGQGFDNHDVPRSYDGLLRLARGLYSPFTTEEQTPKAQEQAPKKQRAKDHYGVPIPSDTVFHVSTKGGKYQTVVTLGGVYRGVQSYDLKDYTSGRVTGIGTNDLAGLQERIRFLQDEHIGGTHYRILIDTLGLVPEGGFR